MLALDTNTISYFLRNDPHVVARMLPLKPPDMVVPAVVVHELRYGLRRLPAQAAQARQRVLDHFLMPLRVLAFDAACAVEAADIRAHLDAIGMPIGHYDLLIAATVRQAGFTLVTRNVREFGRVPSLSVLNWHPD